MQIRCVNDNKNFRQEVNIFTTTYAAVSIFTITSTTDTTTPTTATATSNNVLIKCYYTFNNTQSKTQTIDL